MVKALFLQQVLYENSYRQFFFFFPKRFIYPFERERAQAGEAMGGEGERENLKKIPCGTWSPMQGLIP